MADEDKSSAGSISDTVKRVFALGLSAAFLTEESIRAYLSEAKLPKDILNLILQSAQKSKEEITLKVGREVAGIIEKIDFVKELSKFAQTHKFKVTAEIEITKKDP
jgi:hypothetical protein